MAVQGVMTVGKLGCLEADTLAYGEGVKPLSEAELADWWCRDGLRWAEGMCRHRRCS